MKIILEDIVLAGSPTIEEAHYITTATEQMLATAGINLCKWVANSAELKRKWNESTTDHTLAPETHVTVRNVHSLVWRPETDNFFIMELEQSQSIHKYAGRDSHMYF